MSWAIDSAVLRMRRSLYNTIIVIRILLTWFPNPPQVIAGPLRCASRTSILHDAFSAMRTAACKSQHQCLWGSLPLSCQTGFGWCARSTLCDPYLNLFRGIIPPIGGTLDLSPILAFVALDVSFCADACPGFMGTNFIYLLFS